MSSNNPVDLDVHVLSPKKPLAHLKAKSVSLPGTAGYMEILPNHAPLISQIEIGYLKISQIVASPKPHPGDVQFFIAGGYVDVVNNKVTVLVDVAESPEEIDRKRAEDAKRRAEERLAKRESAIDLNRAQAALLRAMSRLNFLDMAGKEKRS
jgi:F-type H+-transporting ATPase subunit epsilon